MSEPLHPRQELIRLRIAAGLTRREQARLISVGHNTLERAENGETIRLRTAQRIARFYERPLLDLFPEADGRMTLDVPVHRPVVNS